MGRSLQAVIDRGAGVPQSAEQADQLQEAGKIEPPNVVTRQISREELAARGEDEPNSDDIPFSLALGKGGASYWRP